VEIANTQVGISDIIFEYFPKNFAVQDTGIHLRLCDQEISITGWKIGHWKRQD